MCEKIPDDVLGPACRKAGTDEHAEVIERALYLYVVMSNAEEIIEREGYDDPPAEIVNEP